MNLIGENGPRVLYWGLINLMSISELEYTILWVWGFRIHRCKWLGTYWNYVRVKGLNGGGEGGKRDMYRIFYPEIVAFACPWSFTFQPNLHYLLHSRGSAFIQTVASLSQWLSYPSNLLQVHFLPSTHWVDSVDPPEQAMCFVTPCYVVGVNNRQTVTHSTRWIISHVYLHSSPKRKISKSQLVYCFSVQSSF